MLMRKGKLEVGDLVRQIHNIGQHAGIKSYATYRVVTEKNNKTKQVVTLENVKGEFPAEDFELISLLKLKR